MPPTQSVPSTFYSNIVGFPLWVDTVVLGAGTAESYTVPANAGYAVITSALPFYGCISGTAVAPTTEIVDGTGSFYIGAGIQCRVDSGSTISLIRGTAASTIITIGIYKS